MKPLLPSVSVIIVARERCPPLTIISQLPDHLERLFAEFEFVIVANEADEAVALQLKELVEHLPDSLAVFLGERVHDDVARLIGIDHAVSDYVLFVTPTLGEVASLPPLIEPLRSGSDLVIGRSPRVVERGAIRRGLFLLFQALFRLAAGKVFEDQPTAFRILSRAAALYVATRRDGEVLMRARTLGSGFPAAEVIVSSELERARKKPSLLGDLGRAARLIATGSTTLLRASSYIAVAGGVASAIYAAYVILIYFFYSDVQPGWTTLSLQLSGMLLLFSIQFLLLSEHVMQLAADRGASPRHHLVIREVRSPRSRRISRLNVVDHQGRFELGAPHGLAGEPRESAAS